MKKRIIIWCLMLILIPLNVKAEEKNIKITKVELEEKSENVEVIEEPSISLKNINFNLKFSEVGNYIKYKVTLKNESNESYEITNENKISGDYIKYEFSYDNIIKPGEEKSIYITISYLKEVPEDAFSEGKYSLNKSVVIDMTNDTIIVTVPNTISNSIFIIVATLILIILIITAIIFKKNNSKLSIIICLLLLPVAAQALQKISIVINTKIEIEKPNLTQKVYAINTNEIYKDLSTLQDIEQTYNSCADTGKNVCLRYTIENNIVTGAETCFIKEGTEHCLTGWVDECLWEGPLASGACTYTGATIVYNTNKGLLDTIFTETDVCDGGNSSYSCDVSGLSTGADSRGNVSAGDGSWFCGASRSGNANCYVNDGNIK